VYFARALGAARSGNIASARKEVEQLQSLHDELVETKQSYWAEQVEIQRRAAAAWLAQAEGKSEEAVRLMRSAADLEDATEKHPVTPGPIVPARELLGDLLLELKQPEQALREFEASLSASPNRFHGLFGAARAAQETGDAEKARGYYAHVVSLSKHGDTHGPY
jgi:tetratricopeptide (TPR) repeat protein